MIRLIDDKQVCDDGYENVDTSGGLICRRSASTCAFDTCGCRKDSGPCDPLGNAQQCQVECPHVVQAHASKNRRVSNVNASPGIPEQGVSSVSMVTLVIPTVSRRQTLNKGVSTSVSG